MGNNEQNNNYNKSITISFKGKNYILKYDENMTFFELLKKFDKEYLESKYDLDNLIFFINGVICHPDSTIKSFDYYITDNCIFELNFKKFNGDGKDRDGKDGNSSFYNYDKINFIKIDNEKNINDLNGVEEKEGQEENSFEEQKNHYFRRSRCFGGKEEKEEEEKELKRCGLKPLHLKNNKISDVSLNLTCNKEKKHLQIQDNNILKDKKEQEQIKDPNLFNMEINIRFIKSNLYNFEDKLNKTYLSGLLKLCLLKEITIRNDFDKIPNYILNILTILKNNKITYSNVEEGIIKVLKKIEGANILNFSKYIDEIIQSSDIDKYLIPNLNSNTKEEIFYIYNCLSKYDNYEKKLQIELERAKRESVFEYSIISSVIIEKKNVDEYEKIKNECPNRADRVLFHGTSEEAISKILPDMFKISIEYAQHGKGVYFTEDLDSCWIYGSENNFNGKNELKRDLNIPKIGECLNFICSYIYYDKTKHKRVYDWKEDPEKNGVNIAYAGMKKLETIKEKVPNSKVFFGTEFVIRDNEQICPFISFKSKRVEYYVIWRDINFSNQPVYNNKFDEIFKKYLKDRIEYINKIAKFNIYTCKTSEEALRLIKRKKYNKIILISNIGTDFGGRDYIKKARKIIGNDIIVLFNAYTSSHLDWVKNFPNALFSNEPWFYEDFLDCFYENDEEKTKEALNKIKNKMEEHYKVKFNFNDKFLEYPNFKIKGHLEDLRF